MRDARILTVNAGSSSIKFAVFENAGSLARTMDGEVKRIGLSGATLAVKRSRDGPRDSARAVEASDHEAAACLMIETLETHLGSAALAAIGHRVVHGGPRYGDAECVTPQMLDELRRISAFDPQHLPAEIRLIEILQARFPRLAQVACFDTAFHRDLPRVARLLPIPRRYEAQGIRRYGFHGLSYAFLMQELARVAGPDVARGRIVLAHLGNGASLAAVHEGKAMDTSMGFTPTAGFPMSTRSGDLDPGLVAYLARTEHMNAQQFHDLVNFQSGLLGISETSSDMRDLLECEKDDVRAAEAVALFCYQVRKWIGAFAAVLGGIDTLVFAGGIGERSPQVRERICAGLDFLDIALDKAANAAGEGVISSGGARVIVRVIRTDEESMIAAAACRVLGIKEGTGT